MIGPFTQHNGWLTKPLKHPVKYFGSGMMNYFDKDGFELTLAEVEILRTNGIDIPKYKDCVMFQKTVHLDLASRVSIFTPPSISVDHAAAFVRFGFAGELRDQIIENVDNLRQIELVKLLSIKPKWGLDISLDFIDIDVHEQKHELFEILHIEHDFDSCAELTSAHEEFAEKVISMSHAKWSEVINAARLLNSLGLDIGPLRDAKAKLFGYEYGERARKIY